MALGAINKNYEQREDEVIPYTFDYLAACKDSNGHTYDSILTADVTCTLGLTLSTPSVGTTTVQVMASGGTVDETYNLRCLANMVSGQKRDLACAITVRAKAVTP